RPTTVDLPVLLNGHLPLDLCLGVQRSQDVSATPTYAYMLIYLYTLTLQFFLQSFSFTKLFTQWTLQTHTFTSTYCNHHQNTKTPKQHTHTHTHTHTNN